MASKKLIAGVLITLVSVGIIIGLVPVFIYGFGTQAISFDMGMDLSGTPSSSSSNQKDFGSLTTIDVETTVIIVNPYDYFFRKFGGAAQAVEKGVNFLQEYVDFLISINVTAPESETLSLSFTLEDLRTQSVNILLGPDEIPIVNGTYEISIIVTVTITIPGISYEETFQIGPIIILIDLIIVQ